MASILQQLFGTKRGAAMDASPVVQTAESFFMGQIAQESPTAQALIQFVQKTWPQIVPPVAPVPPGSIVLTQDEVDRIDRALNATLSALGMPAGAETEFDGLFAARLQAEGFTLPVGVTAQ